MKLFVLSQKHLALSRAELAAQYGQEKIVLEKGYISIVTSWSRRYERLAFTKFAYRILFGCRKKDLLKEIKNHNWNKIITNKTYKIESGQNGTNETKRIAKEVWSLLRRPKVKLNGADVIVRFFFVEETAYATVLEWVNKRGFTSRKAHKRPGFYPASLDPQLARCFVNLGGVRGSIVDPFCGTGGILLEAALLGHRTYGLDKSAWMLEKCKKNIAHFKLRQNISVAVGDATSFYKRCSAIVTEPPFGKNTKAKDLHELYYNFLVNAKRSTKRIVMSFPNWVSWQKIVRKSGWEVIHTFDWYVHKSMTRKIVVLGR